METVVPIHVDTRHRRNHSRHHSNLSLGGMSFQSLNIDESEEPQDRGHNRKQSFHDIPHSLAWSMSDCAVDDDEEDQTEDDRDARERLLSEGDVRRERLMTDDDFTSRQLSSRDLDCKPSPGAAAPIHILDNIHEDKNAAFSHIVDNKMKSDFPVDPRTVSCFRGIGLSCPEIPSLDESLLDRSEQVDLVLRRARAFSEDSDNIYRRTPSLNNPDQDITVHRYERSYSMLIDSKFGSMKSPTESPTSVWVYWEENLKSPTARSPISYNFQPQQF